MTDTTTLNDLRARLATNERMLPKKPGSKTASRVILDRIACLQLQIEKLELMTPEDWARDEEANKARIYAKTW